MARRLLLRSLSTAIDDADTILERIGYEDPGTAARFTDALVTVFSRLQTWPRTGRRIARHREPYREVRSYPVPRFRTFVVYYAIEEDELIILRVMRGAAVRSRDAVPRD